MRWLPEHGVAIVGLSDVTYTAPTRAITEALEVMRRRGSSSRACRSPPPRSWRYGRTSIACSCPGTTPLPIGSWPTTSSSTARARRGGPRWRLFARDTDCAGPEGPLRAENALRGGMDACLPARTDPRLRHAGPHGAAARAVSRDGLGPAFVGSVWRLWPGSSRVGSVRSGASVTDLLTPGVDQAAVAKSVSAAVCLGRVAGPGVKVPGELGARTRPWCVSTARTARSTRGWPSRARPAGFAGLTLAPPSGETCVP